MAEMSAEAERLKRECEDSRLDYEAICLARRPSEVLPRANVETHVTARGHNPSGGEEESWESMNGNGRPANGGAGFRISSSRSPQGRR